jgi:hypothetical protein
MSNFARMVECDIVVHVDDAPGFARKPNVTLIPPMDDWRFDMMTRMEAEIVLTRLVQEVWEKLKDEPVSSNTRRLYGHVLQGEIRKLVEQGMFVGRRPVSSHVWKGSNERPDDPRK